jgi:hypothetical protein
MFTIVAVLTLTLVETDDRILTVIEGAIDPCNRRKRWALVVAQGRTVHGRALALSATQREAHTGDQACDSHENGNNGHPRDPRKLFSQVDETKCQYPCCHDRTDDQHNGAGKRRQEKMPSENAHESNRADHHPCSPLPFERQGSWDTPFDENPDEFAKQIVQHGSLVRRPGRRPAVSEPIPGKTALSSR